MTPSGSGNTARNSRTFRAGSCRRSRFPSPSSRGLSSRNRGGLSNDCRRCAFVYHSCDKSGFCLNIRERAEKCGGYVLLLENVEHGRCVSVLPAAVKGEIEDFFFRLHVYRDGVEAFLVEIFLRVRRVLVRNAVFGYAVAVSTVAVESPRVFCGSVAVSFIFGSGESPVYVPVFGSSLPFSVLRCAKLCSRVLLSSAELLWSAVQSLSRRASDP